MLKIQLKKKIIHHTKKQEYHNSNMKRKSTEMNQMLKLSEKEFKAAIIKCFANNYKLS